MSNPDDRCAYWYSFRNQCRFLRSQHHLAGRLEPAHAFVEPASQADSISFRRAADVIASRGKAGT